MEMPLVVQEASDLVWQPLQLAPLSVAAAAAVVVVAAVAAAAVWPPFVAVARTVQQGYHSFQLEQAVAFVVVPAFVPARAPVKEHVTSVLQRRI